MNPDALDERTLRRLIQVGRSLVVRLDLEGILDQVLQAARDLTGARYAELGVFNERKSGLARRLTLGSGQGASCRDADHRDGEPGDGMQGFLAVPIRVRDEVWGNLHVAGKRQGAFNRQDEEAVVILAEWAAIAIENARLYEGMARRRDEIQLQRDHAERSLTALKTMMDIAHSVGDEPRPVRVLELIVNRGRALVSSRLLLILLAEGDELVVAAAEGGAEGTTGCRISIAGSLPGQVLEEGRTQRLSELDGWASELAELGIEAEAALVVPLSFRGVASGVMVAIDREKDGPGFGPADEVLLESFAASAATAVAIAKSVERERLRHSLEAAEQERKRWARELHDETLQALGGLRMLHSAALKGKGRAEDLRRVIEEGLELVDEEIENLNALIVELRPAALDQIGLAPALRTLAERLSRTGGVQIDVLVRLGGGVERLPAELESSIYRLVQEGLNNVVKHARAGRAEAVVEYEQGCVRVELRDDGVGFDPGAVERGFGLIGMRERAELAGGRLEVDSAPGAGTRVRARIPVAIEDADGAAAPVQSSSRPLSST